MSSLAAEQAAVGAFPAKIGRFHVRKILGRGGQGVVYLAQDPKLEREVAIKTLLTDTVGFEHLISEAKNVARLEHPGIVPLYEIDQSDGQVSLVYQFVRGQTLSAWLKSHPERTPHECAALIREVLNALAYAHEQGVIHRDLSPGNIVIDEKNHPRILDFGVSALVGKADHHDQIVGTVNYLPPECVSNATIGTYSDVFSLSVIFHEMLTDQRLFQADSTMATVYKIVNEPIATPSTQNHLVDAALDTVIMRGLAREPSQRFQTAREMLSGIDAYLKPDSKKDNSEPSKYGSAIEFMLRKVARKPDFPAVSRYISDINQKTGTRGSTDASELADVILKDYALTSKLLRLVNSAVFGHYGGSIGTVSRAVVILGFDQVRAAALSIAVFEHLQNGQQADALKDAACGSFLSAMLARDLVDPKSGLDPEEAFIGAMFHRLGRHLTIYYFPDEFEEIKSLVASKGVSENVAAHEILGTSFDAFGLAIGEQWNLPKAMLNCMKPQPDGPIKASDDPAAKVAEISALANELSEICGHSDKSNLNEKLKALSVRYRDCMTLNVKTLREKVANGIDATREYANVLSVDLESAAFFGNVMKHFGGDADLSTQNSIKSNADTSVQAIDHTQQPPPTDRKAFLVEAITQLTSAMLNGTSPNEILSMVITSMYHGMSFSRVVLMIRDPKRHMMQARSGYGQNIDELVPNMGFKTSQQPDLFNQAIRKGKEFVVLDGGQDQYHDQIPKWCRVLLNPQSLLLFPIMANGNCIGLIYADQVDKPAKISAEEIKLLVTLVQQSSLAIQQRG